MARTPKQVDPNKQPHGTVRVLSAPKNELSAWLREKRHGAEIGLTVSAIMAWFNAQDDTVKLAVLTGVNSDAGPAYAAMLRQIADRLERGASSATADCPLVDEKRHRVHEVPGQSHGIEAPRRRALKR